jgi:hypothetical protein
MKQQNSAACADFIKISATGTASLIFSVQPKSDVQRIELMDAISVKEKSGDASAAHATTRSTKKDKTPRREPFTGQENGPQDIREKSRDCLFHR